MSWKNAMIIMAGLVLNCVVFGALFRPVEENKQKSSKKEQEGENPSSPESVPLEETPRIEVFYFLFVIVFFYEN